MPIPQLRDYQAKFVNAYKASLQLTDRTLGYAPTGAGKTVMLAAICKWLLSKPGVTIQITVHREALIDQTVAVLERFNITPGIIAGGYREYRQRRVQVVSVQTLAIRPHPWWKPKVTINDEAHLTTYTEILNQIWAPYDGNGFSTSKGDRRYLLGLTGTPWRLKARESLGDYYNHLICAPPPGELIKRGFLSPPSYYRILNDHMNLTSKVEYLWDQWNRYAQNRLTIVFCPRKLSTQEKSTAEMGAAYFRERGINAVSVTATTRDRQQIYKDFAAGKIRVLFSVGCLTEGFDVPGVGCVVLFRKTSARSLYYQMIGRGSRLAPGKTDFLVFDMAGLLTTFQVRFEDIQVDKNVLYVPDDLDDEYHVPMKTCPQCEEIARQKCEENFKDQELAAIAQCCQDIKPTKCFASAKRCHICGYEFEFQPMERFDPHGNLIRSWGSRSLQQQCAFYQRLLRRAYQEGRSPDWADRKYIAKFSHEPPKDWRRNAVLGPQSSDEDQAKFREYLEKLYLSEMTSESQQKWVWEQLTLELGNQFVD